LKHEGFVSRINNKGTFVSKFNSKGAGKNKLDF
jgi:DNA-binding GntR family transcriptional regulator